MSAKSRFMRLDAFTKTVEDARIRTTTGGIVTIASLLIMLFLIWGEWADYRRITVNPELVVDKGRSERMEIHLNITFPRLPCELLTLDVMDVSGDIQSGVMHGVDKVRLKSVAEGSGMIETKALALNSEPAPHLDPDYCGNCYSAPPPPTAQKPGCCQTCEEVREAYAAISWSFGHGEGVEQCQREHYAEKLEAQIKEGCRIQGRIRVNKVIGNFHFAPGKSYSNGQMHVHDLANYYSSKEKHTFTHQIHQLRFGPQLDEGTTKKFASRTGADWANHHIDPLDGTTHTTDETAYNFMYFVKVVSTAYLPIGWDKRDSNMWSDSSKIPNELIELGKYGYGEGGSIETHQYSVTSHERPLMGGDDARDGHKERIHARNGIPGVFFSYDISPMKVINKETRDKSFSAFLVGVCAVIGGTLTVASVFDRFIYEGAQQVKKMKER